VGVIRKAAIRAFLARPRRDYRPWKNYSEEKLLAIRERLPVRPPVWNVLRIHQKVCLLIGALERHFGFFLDTGMGKSFLTVALLRYFKKAYPNKRQRFLVLVPAKINKDGWELEVAKHAAGRVSLLMLAGSSENKWKQLLASDADIVVETYGGMMRMVSKLHARTGKKKGSKQRFKWNEALINKFAAQFDGLICDESIRVMNKDSLLSRCCYQIRKRMEYCFELNATPFGKDPEPIWGQLYLMDKGATLGETLGLFRAAFYTSKEDTFGRTEWTFNKKMERTLHDFLAARTISYEADESDLPAVSPMVIKVEMPEDAEAYADRARQSIIASHGNYQESKNAFMRMRQISSGWMGFKDDESGDRAQVNFKPNYKLEYLLDFIFSINPKYKWIVFHEFNYSGALISKALHAEGMPHAWVYGKTKDPGAELRRFVGTSAAECPGLLLSNALGSGHNLQIAKYGIFFEAPVSPIVRYQCRKRYERQESPHKTVFRVDLVMPGTYDESILKFHKQGQDLFDAIVRGKFKRSGQLLVPTD
jgi:SNF2 family DNA or RNA helicase